MSKNRRPRLNAVRSFVRAIIRTGLRARLIALLVLVAAVTTIAFTSTGYAQRVIDLVGTRLSEQSPARTTKAAGQTPEQIMTAQAGDEIKPNVVSPKPKEGHLVKAHEFKGDLRDLPYIKPVKRERPEREEPEPNPTVYPGTTTTTTTTSTPEQVTPSAPAPAPITTFDGLDFATFGAGHPPDTNGDVGPVYYIQTVNTSIGIYNKSTDVRVAAFTFNTFMSQGSFGNLCDTDNFG